MEDCSTDERLPQEALCHRQWTDEYVEHPETLMRQNVVVVWIQCLLVDVASRIIANGQPVDAELLDRRLHSLDSSTFPLEMTLWPPS